MCLMSPCFPQCLDPLIGTFVTSCEAVFHFRTSDPKAVAF